ncbi:MAG: DUF3048 C-terminal domain-containing protein [Anaerolineaceae bacterium]|nr:DUF3048 C-terminal domain-containing protein [Anaerolineaceae bacterium]
MMKKILSFLILIAVVTGCSAAAPNHQNPVQNNAAQQAQQLEVGSLVQSVSTDEAPADMATSVPPQLPESEPATATSTPSSPSQPAATATEPPVELGPDNFPPGINPLTGLPVENSAALAYSPALVSITNFPTTARPQAGLSFSPLVFEMYIGEGMTRFLALFYGDYPQKGEDSSVTLSDDRIGPVRSGRLPYESLRKLYNGFLVMASASPNVKSSLSSFTNVWGSDTGDINSAMIPVTKLEEIASKNPDRVNAEMLTGLKFDQTSPPGGKTANKIWIPFNYLNQVIWKYDPSSSAYLRFQDNADGVTFIQAIDRLNKQPLTYENVVVLFADHAAKRETLIDINLMYIDRLPALLFRDGKMYEIFWTTANSDYEKTTGKVRPIRFIDASGNPFPLKPGQTWVEMVQMYTHYNETVNSDVYFDLKNKTSPGSGYWAIQFFPTVPERK